MRAFVLVLAPDVALRSLATTEDGRREVQVRGIGPGIADCPNTSTGWYLGFDLEMPRFGAEPPALKLRDDGVLLCATLALPDPEGRDCGPPPLDAESSRLLSHVTPESTTIAGVVTRDVGSVEVVFAGGETQLVPTTEETYAGRYRGLIRSFSLTVPGERDPRAARLIGVDGRRQASIRLSSWPEFVRAPRTVLRGPGGWRLAAGIVSGGGLAGRRLGCLQLTRGAPSDDVLSCDTLGASKQVRVTCRPKRTLVFGQVAPGVRRMEVRTTRGAVTARIVSLRRLGISARAFLAELPAAAALGGLEVHADRVRRPRLNLPPASRQCGYGESF
jgi:hypothetical protein